MATFDQFLDSLDPDENIRGDQFEKIFVKWFLEHEPTWAAEIDKIWLYKDYPDSWGPDTGVDLLFRDKKLTLSNQ